MILLLLAVRTRSGQEKQGSCGNFKAQGSAWFVGKKSTFRTDVFMLLILVNILRIK